MSVRIRSYRSRYSPIDRRSTAGRLPVDRRSTADRPPVSTTFRPPIDRQSTASRPPVDALLTAGRPQAMCRKPDSQKSQRPQNRLLSSPWLPQGRPWGPQERPQAPPGRSGDSLRRQWAPRGLPRNAPGLFLNALGSLVVHQGTFSKTQAARGCLF